MLTLDLCAMSYRNMRTKISFKFVHLPRRGGREVGGGGGGEEGRGEGGV